ncbi:hypothetical protein HY989_02945 [Candidatus Micrarchaeota archaeon]|nr:hypothetical protein [Candidatus Micrarchaeota archaeon]
MVDLGAFLDLASILGWMLIGISGMILKDILKDVRPEHYKLQWKLIYLVLPLLLFYPSFLFYQYFYDDIPLSKKIVTALIVMLSLGCLLLLYLAHQIRSTQLRRELSGLAASILVVYLGLTVYLSFLISDFGEVLNNLLFSSAMFMLSLALFYLANYTLAFAKVVRVSHMLYFAGILVLIPGILRALILESDALNLLPYLMVMKIIGTAAILGAGVVMFLASDKFKRLVLEFDVKIK